MKNLKTRLLAILFLCLSFLVNAQCWSDKIYNDSYILKTDGTLWGFYPSQNYFLVQLSSETNWSSYIGNDLFLKNDGSIWSLDRTSLVFTQINVGNNWKKISIYSSAITGIKMDNTIWGWPDLNINSAPIQIGTDSDWISFDYYGGFSFAKKLNGTLWSWGQNNYGQLGLGTNSYVYTPTQVGNSSWLKYSFRHGIKADGTLWSWGDNRYGQLGTGGYESSNIPIQIGIDSNWKDISGTHAIKTDGTLWCWGHNFYYSLGISSNGEDVLTPTQVGSDTNWDNFNHDLAQKTDGSFWGWGGFNAYSGISTTSYPDYFQPREIIGGGNFQAIKLVPFTQPNSPAPYTYFEILALNNDNSLFVWGIFGLYRGSYNISYSNRIQIGCKGTLSTNKTAQKEIAVFPNPVRDVLNIETEDQLNKAEIFDISGRLLQTLNITNNQINMSQLQKGIYLLKLYGSDTVYSSKISKE